jgi:uncharacterized membrane protein YhaH (DUF805 family)
MRTPVPLWAPAYGASLPVALVRFWRKYARFDGRAGRSEFWWWVLVDAVVFAAIFLGIRFTAAQPGPGVLPGAVVLAVWILATAVPTVALLARRFHDLNLSGWLLLILLVPTIGQLVVAVLAVLPPNSAGARFDRPDAELPGYRPGDPDADLPPRDFGWPPSPLPYAGPAGGQPLFDGPRQPPRPRNPQDPQEPEA